MSRSGEEGNGEETTTRREELGIDNADADDDPAFASSSSSFLSWCRSKGIRIRPSLRCTAVAIGGRGVVSCCSSGEEIEAGTALVRVPRRWIFSLGGALAEGVGGDGDGGGGAFRAAVEEVQGKRRGRSINASSLLPPEALLACYLLLEAWKVECRREKAGEDEEEDKSVFSPQPPPSRWEPYLLSLPSSYPLLMQTVADSSSSASSSISPLERDAVFALFSGIPAARAAAEQATAEVAADVAEAAAALVAAAASRSCRGGGADDDASSASSTAAAASASASAFSFARERFAWARASVRSRAMFLSDDDDRATSFGSSAAAAAAQASQTPPLPSPSLFASAGALLPFGDLFNHAHAPPPEEPDTGGSCRSCEGWHSAPGVCCESGEEREEVGAEEATEAAAAAEAEVEAAEEPRPSSPPPPSNSWGDGAFDRTTSEFVVWARRSYSASGDRGKVGRKEEEKEGEKEGERQQQGEEEGANGKREVQIFLTYASDADNLATLSNYGFVDRGNPHDRCPLSLEAWRSVADKSARAAQEEARRRGRRDSGNNASSLLRWRAEALKVLLSSSSSPYSSSQEPLFLEADSWCHSLSGAPGWNLLSALRSAFLATELLSSSASFSVSSSSSHSSSSPLSLRRAAVASGGSPGTEVDAAAFSALAEAARAARELARPGDAEQERILERAEAAEAAEAAAARDSSGGGSGGDTEPASSVGGSSEGLVAAARWRQAWVQATERVVRHASRVAEAAKNAAAATTKRNIVK